MANGGHCRSKLVVLLQAVSKAQFACHCVRQNAGFQQLAHVLANVATVVKLPVDIQTQLIRIDSISMGMDETLTTKMANTSISFQDRVTDFEALSDAEFLSRISWTRSAGKQLLAAAQLGDVATFVDRWQKSLSKRGLKKKTVRKHASSFSLWSRHAFEGSSGSDIASQMLEAVFHGPAKTKSAIGAGKSKRRHKKKSKSSKRSGQSVAELNRWLSNLKPNELGSPFELLTLLELLARRVSESDPQTTWLLWRTTLSQAIRFADELHEPEGNSIAADQRLLVTGELPWQIGLLFADVDGAKELAAIGKKVLRGQLEENTDTDGTPKAELVDRLPLWLAALVRSAEVASLFDEPLWDDDSAERFHDLVSIVAPMCGEGGRIALTNGASNGMGSMLETAARVARLRKNTGPRDLLRQVANGAPKKNSRPKSSGARTKGNFPVTQSDWAQLACLRSDWSADANSIVVAHHRQLPQIELVAAGRQLLSGNWDIEVCVAGQPVTLEDSWDCVCWNSDADADFLELQMTTDEDVQIDRQILLSRKGDFAILADGISNAGNKQIDYLSRLPLVTGVEAESLSQTRECRLIADKRVARMFPLALPQNRVQSTSGTFGETGSQVVLTQFSSGDGLFAPVVIDWHPLRRRADVDWRTLTVTEDREILSPGIAAGHRLRIGKHHLFVYRSLLKPETARAVLGHHTSHETVIGQFSTDGNIQPILLVE